MSKYDFSIDKLDPNTAYGKVLGRVKPGSAVLECGCATGYMTRYMKEKLGCEVDVIEKNREALEKAIPYANTALRCDLEETDWKLILVNKQYDYILFADVLEHLVDPISVLRFASGLLNPDGRIIVSIPNICHNDVLIKMYYDLFTYTQYGILDNTHLRFWGYFNFVQLCQNLGLKVIDTDRVMIGTGLTEQGMETSKLDPDLMKALKKRLDGEVFQWIFELRRQ